MCVYIYIYIYLRTGSIPITFLSDSLNKFFTQTTAARSTRCQHACRRVVLLLDRPAHTRMQGMRVRFYHLNTKPKTLYPNPRP